MTRIGKDPNHATAADAMGALSDGDTMTIFSRGSFGLGDMVEHAIDAVGPATVLIASWQMGAADIRRFGLLLKSSAVTDIMVLCDRGLPSRHPQYAEAIEAAFGLDRVRVSRLKANFSVVRGLFDVVIRGSGGFARSRGLDIYDVDCDAGLARFFLESVETLTGSLPTGWASTVEVDDALRAVGARQPTPRYGMDKSKMRF